MSSPVPRVGGRPPERRTLGLPVSALALVLTPLVWAALLGLDYVLLSWSCTAAQEGTAAMAPRTAAWLLAGGTAAGGALVGWATLVAGRAWRRVGADDRAGEVVPEGLRGFLAFGGLFFGAMFAFGIALLVGALLLLSPCGGTP